MVSHNRLKTICGKGIYNNIPVNNVELFNITHNRYKKNGEILAKGGHTVCYVKIDGNEYIGLSYCSKEDNFCKKTGRKLAVKRAFEKYWKEKFTSFYYDL